jgi:hypothetical protein
VIAIALQVDLVFDTRPSKYVMTPFHPALEAEAFE